MSTAGVKDTGIRVEVERTRVRQTPKTDFGSQLKTGMGTVGDGVSNAAQVAAPFVPGGAVISAAISGVGSVKNSVQAGPSTGSGAFDASMGGGNARTVSGTGVIGGSGGGGTSTEGHLRGLANAGDKDANIALNNNETMRMAQSFNMYYLKLQEDIQNKSRQFTTLSNVMKTRYDMDKTAIGNLR